MNIFSPHGSEIFSLDDWASFVRKTHWKKGRSALSVADFILNREGAAHLESQLSQVLQQEVSIRRITPEKQVRFDLYGRGRFHDLAMDCVVSDGKSLFVGLEAKVDESFGNLIQDELINAEKELARNPRSKALQRIRDLPARYSPSLSANSMLDVRYQLVHGTAGTVSALRENEAPYDMYVFFVLVFKTALYDQQKGAENHRDYLRFLARVGASPIDHPHVEAHSLTLDGRTLICIYEHIEVHSYT